MTDLRVPTLRQPVTVTCTDGRTFDGHIFMPSQSSRHQGPMSPEEWSDTVHTFFPFRPKGAASSTIFNLDSVAAFTVPAEAGGAAGDADDGAASELPVFRVSVDARGATFEGLVVIDMPPDHQRVVDWLNAPAAFITVRAQGTHHLIQKRHVTRVVEIERTHA